MMRALVLAGLLSFAGAAALAEESTIYFVARCAKVVAEYEPKENMLHIRSKGSSNCSMDPESVEAALDKSLAQHDDLKLIFLGRIQNYWWIKRKIVALAAEDDVPDGKWDGGTGKARGDGGNNAYLAHLFADPRKAPFAPTVEAADVLWPIRAVLDRHGYVVTGASVEKVITTLVERPQGNGNKRRLPTDALVHLRIAKAP